MSDEQPQPTGTIHTSSAALTTPVDPTPATPVDPTPATPVDPVKKEPSMSFEQSVKSTVSKIEDFIASAGDERVDDDKNDPYGKLKVESARVAFFLLFSLLAGILLPHETMSVLVMISLISVIVLSTHLFRKFLMSYVNMEDLYNDMRKGNVASSIGFTAVIAFICTVIVVMTHQSMPQVDTSERPVMVTQSEAEPVQETTPQVPAAQVSTGRR